MKLPSGIEVKNETLSGIADFIAMDMLTMESSFSDSAETVSVELEDGYGGEHETLPELGLEDRMFLIEAVRVPALEYLEKLRLARSNLFDELLKNKEW